MNPFWKRRPAMADQAIIDSIVHGDVIYIRDITGDVTINKAQRRYRYWCQPFPKVASLRPRQAVVQPRLVLDPAYQIAPLVGRTQELDDLHRWLNAPPSVAVRLLHAEAGHGKTRLVEHVRHASERQGWLVAQAVHTLQDVDESATVELGERRALFLVVDEAHRWPTAHLETVAVNLRALHNKLPELRVRLLLVARTPGQWWSVVAARLRELGVDESTVALAPLGMRFSRAEVFDSAVTSFRQALYAAPPQVRAPDPATYRAGVDLAGSRFDSVLAIHMAALVAVHARANKTNLPTGRSAISAYLVDNEHAEWSRRYETGELRTRPEVMRRLVYLAVLTRGLPREHARRLLIATHLAGDEQQADILLDDHARCFPHNDVVLAPLRPDQLAEDFLALTTPGHPEAATITQQADTWVTALASDMVGPDHEAEPWLAPILTTLVESAANWPHLATRVLFPLLARGPLLVADAGEATLRRLTELPGIEPVVLTTLYQHLRDSGDSAAEILDIALLPSRIQASTDDEERARLYTRHAEHLRGARHLRQACDAAEQAVAHYRRLVKVQSQAYLPSLAMSLKNLGTALSEVGRDRDAVASAEKSVSLYRRLAKAQPEVYLPGLAMSLDNLGGPLGQLGRVRDALVAVEESVSLYRRLAEAQPEAYLPDLARSLNNLGTRLRHGGRLHEALAPAEESVALRRRLAEAQPEAYLPDLALALNNLGTVLNEAGRYRDAVAPAEESVSLYRKLAEARPQSHLPGLATSLNSLGNRLGSVGRIQEAVVATEESVTLCRRLAEAQPEVYLPDLARSLTNLGTRLAQGGHLQEALAPAEESVAIRRRLAEAQLETHSADLATSLNNLGHRLAQLGRVQEAVAPVEESVSLELLTGSVEWR
ncbi:tetratricopeptide repeat protein [Nocardia asiatica]|uniref:tetratricopeptide repeat protein n=1 Tax=Nocardia asiatica TaxID=209252 RepID=UPI002454CAD3|nr:tetratricopeptide repeat protein [Nocardia asiatica]